MSEYVILVWPYGFSLSWSTDDSTRQWWSGTESTKYRLTCQISTRLVHGRSPKLPTVSHFCLVRFCWFFSFGLFNTSQMLIFQRVWSCVDSPLLGVACYIENSMKEAWLLASFQCYATFSLSGGLAEMFPKVSCGNWRSNFNITTSFTALIHQLKVPQRVNKVLVKCVWGVWSEITVFVHFVFYISLSTFTFIFSPKLVQSKFYPLVKVKEK